MICIHFTYESYKSHIHTHMSEIFHFRHFNLNQKDKEIHRKSNEPNFKPYKKHFSKKLPRNYCKR